MSEHLDKARRQVQAGKHKAALDSLIFAEPLVRGGDTQEAAGMLELCAQIGESVSWGAKAECLRLYTVADDLLNAEARLQARVGPLAVSYPFTRFLGINPAARGARGPSVAGRMWFTSAWFGLGSDAGEPREGAQIPAAAIARVELGGGRVVKRAGELAGEFVALGAVGLAVGGVHAERTRLVLHTHSGDAAHCGGSAARAGEGRSRSPARRTGDPVPGREPLSAGAGPSDNGDRRSRRRTRAAGAPA